MEVFHSIDWECHDLAFHSVSPTRRISYCKLIHGLYQTRSRDNKFFGSPNNCPFCPAEETLCHFFTCPNGDASNLRSVSMQVLVTELVNANTPKPLQQAILQGITQWTMTYPDTFTYYISAGQQLLTCDATLAAFTAQTHLGWDQFLRGRVTLKWRSAYCSLWGEQSITASKVWSRHLILSLWTYASSLWKSRNGHIFGCNKISAREKCRAALQERIKRAYKAYANDPFYVSPQHNPLFKRCPMNDRLCHSNASIESWLWTVEEARHWQQIFHDRQTKITKYFLSADTSNWAKCPTQGPTEHPGFDPE